MIARRYHWFLLYFKFVFDIDRHSFAADCIGGDVINFGGFPF